MRKLTLITAALALSTSLATTAAGADRAGMGVAWVGQSELADKLYAAFESRLRIKAPFMEIETHGALADAGALSEAVGKMAAKREGLLLLGDDGARWLSENAVETPVFIGGGDQQVLDGASADRVTGVSHAIDHKFAMEMFAAMAPTATRFAVITQDGHPGGAADAEGVAKACEKMFFECSLHTVASGAELADRIDEVKKGVDAFVLGGQAALYDDADAVRAAVKEARKRPVFALSTAPVAHGALASLAPREDKLGAILADRVFSVLRRDEAISALPIALDPEPILVMNKATFDRLKIDLPRQLMQHSRMVEGG